MTKEINLKNLDKETAEELRQFFNKQPDEIKAWEKGKIYTLENENKTEFTFKNTVFQRKRKARLDEKGMSNTAKEGVRYESISNKEKLGSGGFGSVHKIKGTLALNEDAHHFKKQGKDGKRRVAKIQKHSVLKNPKEKLENEYQLASKAGKLAIKEPTLTEISGELTSFTAMNEASGRQLFAIFNDDRKKINVLTLKQRVDLSKALLEALKEQVSMQGTIHRDIKPDNIYVDLQEPITVTILDYGLARAEDKKDLEEKGTLRFMAPETLALFNKNYNYQVTSKADVYSMARVLGLLWNVSWEKAYSTKDAQFFHLNLTPEGRLAQLFYGIPSLDNKLAGKIKMTLLGMLQNDPDERLSIDEAIAMFPSCDNAVTNVNKNTLQNIPCSKLTHNNHFFKPQPKDDERQVQSKVRTRKSTCKQEPF
jgi:serine/threonine protein kinase